MYLKMVNMHCLAKNFTRARRTNPTNLFSKAESVMKH